MVPARAPPEPIARRSAALGWQLTKRATLDGDGMRRPVSRRDALGSHLDALEVPKETGYEEEYHQEQEADQDWQQEGSQGGLQDWQQEGSQGGLQLLYRNRFGR